LWSDPAGLIVGTVVFAVGQSLAYPAVTLLAIARTRPSERSAAIGDVGASVDSALRIGALALGTASEIVGYAGAFRRGRRSCRVRPCRARPSHADGVAHVNW
jgi:hypothetical protein